MAQVRTPDTKTSPGGGDWVRTVCDYCYNKCGVMVRREGGLAVEIRGDPDNPNNKGKICAKGLAGLVSIYNPHRVKTPLKRTNPQKGVGVDPGWKEIGWEEALSTIAERLKKVRQDDPRKLAYIAWDNAGRDLHAIFQAAFGTPTSLGPSSPACGSNTHLLAYLYHGAYRMGPDLAFCNYLIVFGSQLGSAVDSKSVAAMQAIRGAKVRGMKLIVIDPRFTDAAAIADEWIPIRPCTDAAFALGLINQLLNELGMYDAEFLKKYTNGPYLIGPDGLYVRDTPSGKPLVWDSAAGRALPYDNQDIKEYALEGAFEVNRTRCSPAFQLLKDHVRKYTPEMVSEVTTVPAETVKRIARDFGKAAQIGSTITLQGKVLPLRPVAVHWHKGGAAHKHSMLIGIAWKLLTLVVGANDVPGSVCGAPSDLGPLGWIEDGPDGLMTHKKPFGPSMPAYPPRKVRVPESLSLAELVPVQLGGSLHMLTQTDPKHYPPPFPVEMAICNRTSPATNTVNPQLAVEFLASIPFFVSITTELDETAELADIVLPDVHYLETLLFYPNASVQGSTGQGAWWFMYQQPVVSPPFQAPFKIRHAFDILQELAHRAGFLPDMNKVVNLRWKLKAQYQLDPSRRYDLEEIFDRWARNWLGDQYSIDWFEKNGTLSVPKPIEQAYPRPFLTARAPLYFEHLIGVGREVKAVVEELEMPWDVSDYQPLPDWKPCSSWTGLTPDYDLYAVNFRVPTHALAVSASNPWLNEISDRRRMYDVWINSDTAEKKGIRDGDLLRIESVEGGGIERARAKVTEAIHPEVIGIPGVFGQWSNGRPTAKGRGVHFTRLTFMNMDRVDGVSGAVEVAARVKVTKAQ